LLKNDKKRLKTIITDWGTVSGRDGVWTGTEEDGTGTVGGGDGDGREGDAVKIGIFTVYLRVIPSLI
jgi:hypothetical protein